ncbi:anti-sigma factor [Ferruginibacter albus]|uniref:anti-sigma factor n=1 Tax=Ferruginibacter albus TaxID=2875540 RepID=UPI001CC43A95|nr:anti-sigma factor [Ferruginibacter albus]UAY51497.1 anti-sigma factor [Ferruginibacter albus]
MSAQEIISSGLLELYAAGLTSQEESLQVAQWIKQFPEVAAEFNEIQLSIETLAKANAIEPSPSAKEKIFRQIQQSKPAEIISLNTSKARTAAIPSYWKWVAAASIILLLGSVALNIMLYGKYDVADNKLQQTQQELAGAMKEDHEMDKEMSIVHNKFCQPVALHSTQAQYDAAAKIFWIKNTGDVYIDPCNLPAAPDGKQYQLWGIVDGKPVDAGVIIYTGKQAAANKYHIQKMKSFGKADAFAITIEKAGGNPTPTMDNMVVMGKL